MKFFNPAMDETQARKTYAELSKKLHPDTSFPNKSIDDFVEMKKEWEEMQVILKYRENLTIPHQQQQSNHSQNVNSFSMASITDIIQQGTTLMKEINKLTRQIKPKRKRIPKK